MLLPSPLFSLPLLNVDAFPRGLKEEKEEEEEEEEGGGLRLKRRGWGKDLNSQSIKSVSSRGLRGRILVVCCCTVQCHFLDETTYGTLYSTDGLMGKKKREGTRHIQ